MGPTTTLAVANGYADAVSAKDFAAVADMFAGDTAGGTWQISWRLHADEAHAGAVHEGVAVPGSSAMPSRARRAGKPSTTVPGTTGGAEPTSQQRVLTRR